MIATSRTPARDQAKDERRSAPGLRSRAALPLRAGPASQREGEGHRFSPPAGRETFAGPRLASPGGRITGRQPRRPVRAPAEVSLMGKPVQTVGLRVLSLQM